MKPGKFNFSSDEHLKNISLISSTLSKLKLDISNSFKDEQSENILLILITLLVLKFEAFNSFNDLHL